MEDLLREYLERAFSDRGEQVTGADGPVVTMSREFGCPSKPIGTMVVAELNRRAGVAKPGRWKFINKEVVEATAQHLEMQPAAVTHILNAAGKGLVEDVLASFTNNYVSDHRIRKTIISVVKGIAARGHVVIVGRGGAGILRNRPNTLHIRLQAPPEWRVKMVCESKNIKPADAVRLLDEIDRNRIKMLELVIGEKFSPYFFDAAFNCVSLTKEEIVGSILGMMESKKMI